MPKTLYQTYRPDEFEKVVGQEHIVKTLTNAVKKNRIGQAYLFTGSRGTGKTTVARLLAVAVNCTERENFQPASPEVCERLKSGKCLDVIEIDAASNTGVDNIRELKSSVALVPIEAPFKVYIIDEVHMLSTSAFNALLKTLEEPPAHVIFILATTEIHKVPETIISRCQRFDFNRIDVQNIIAKLSKIAEMEKVKVDHEALEMIAISANGGMRDAESLFSQVLALEDKNISVQEVSEILGTTTIENIFQVIESLANLEIEKTIQAINEVAKNGYNLETFANSLIVKLRSLLFLTLNKEVDNLQNLLILTNAEIEKLQKIAEKVSPNQVVFMLEEFIEALNKVKNATITQLPLEIAVVNICYKNNQNVVSSNSVSVSNQNVAINNSNLSINQNSNSQNFSSENLKNSGNFESKIPDKFSAKIFGNDKVEVKESLKSEKVEIKENQKKTENSSSNSTENSSNNSSQNLDLDPKTIMENWRRTISQISKNNPSLSALLSQCRMLSVENNEIKIAVKYSFHKDKLIEIPNKQIVEKTMAEIFKLPLRIVVEVSNEKENQPEVSELLSEATSWMGGEIVN